MRSEDFLAALSGYESELAGILSRFSHTSDGIHIKDTDDPVYRQKVIEIRDLLDDVLGVNPYAGQVVRFFNEGISNFYGSPSFKSVENILGVLRALIIRVRRNPEILTKTSHAVRAPASKNVFIIHGRDEAKWRELKDILRDRFRLNPIVLQEQPDAGCTTVIEKFEHYAPTCAYAVAIFTPDDQVTDSDGETYLQARPNALYELGWFCGRLGRQQVMLLLKQGTSTFSDFGGIIRKRSPPMSQKRPRR